MKKTIFTYCIISILLSCDDNKSNDENQVPNGSQTQTQDKEPDKEPGKEPDKDLPILKDKLKTQGFDDNTISKVTSSSTAQALINVQSKLNDTKKSEELLGLLGSELDKYDTKGKDELEKLIDLKKLGVTSEQIITLGKKYNDYKDIPKDKKSVQVIINLIERVPDIKAYAFQHFLDVGYGPDEIKTTLLSNIKTEHQSEEKNATAEEKLIDKSTYNKKTVNNVTIYSMVKAECEKKENHVVNRTALYSSTLPTNEDDLTGAYILESKFGNTEGDLKISKKAGNVRKDELIALANRSVDTFFYPLDEKNDGVENFNYKLYLDRNKKKSTGTADIHSETKHKHKGAGGIAGYVLLGRKVKITKAKYLIISTGQTNSLGVNEDSIETLLKSDDGKEFKDMIFIYAPGRPAMTLYNELISKKHKVALLLHNTC